MKDTTLEQLVESHEKAKASIEEMEAAIKVIKDEILERLEKMKATGTKTKNGFFVKKVESTIFSDVSLSTARNLGAVIQKEAIDLSLLRKLKDKGVAIPGARTITWVKVSEAT